MFRTSPWILNNSTMSGTTSTTLSPLVAGAADLARKLAAYKATSNTASGAREEDYAGEVIPSPLDVSFCPKSKRFFLLFHKYFCWGQFPCNPLFINL